MSRRGKSTPRETMLYTVLIPSSICTLQCNKNTLPRHFKKSNSPTIKAFINMKKALTIPRFHTICYVEVGVWLFGKLAEGPFNCGTLLLYGWFELHSTVYTLSILLSFSKNGIRSKSSESVMSSNQDATGTCKEWCRK